MTDIADLDALTAPASGDLFHVIDISETAARQDKNITRQYLLGYTEYVALLTQASTDAPTAVDIKNDTGATVIWAIVGTGSYTATFSSEVLTANKTIACMCVNNVTRQMSAIVNSTTVVGVATANSSGIAGNGYLSSTPVIIRIYV